MEEKKLVGFDIVEKSVSLEEESLVGKVSAIHVGKIGSIELSIKGKFEALPLINSAIDKLEEIIPGDQKMIADLLKAAVAKIKIKL